MEDSEADNKGEHTGVLVCPTACHFMCIKFSCKVFHLGLCALRTVNRVPFFVIVTVFGSQMIKASEMQC